MEARVIAIEHQLHSLSQIQKVILSALSSAIKSSVPIKPDIERLLSAWTGETEELQSSLQSLGQVQDSNAEVLDTKDGYFIDSGIATPEEEFPPKSEQLEQLEQLTSDILDIIHRFGKHIAAQQGEPQTEWIGKPMFLGKVRKQLESGGAIKMILPAFPWKSINKTDKVTGVLPDLGEELALARLNEMCESIRAVYPPGGEVHIATDGLVFDDVVGIRDEDTWAYGEGLMQIVRAQGYAQNIHLLRVMDILGYTEGQTLDWDLYSSLVQECRDTLLADYGRTEEEVREMMREDSDTLLTYCGFIRFLESDLKHSEVAKTATSGQKFRKCVKKVAINMMIRAESFTKLLQAKCPDYVRLSIHPSTGAVKLSVPLIITGSGEFPRTPWHSSVALGLDGSYSTVHSRDVRDTHTLVPRDDEDSTPHYFRQKSELWDWDDEEVIFAPQYPNKLIVRPSRAIKAGTKTLSTVQISKLQALVAAHSAGPVVVEGFTNSDAVTSAAGAPAN